MPTATAISPATDVQPTSVDAWQPPTPGYIATPHSYTPVAPTPTPIVFSYEFNNGVANQHTRLEMPLMLSLDWTGPTGETSGIVVNDGSLPHLVALAETADFFHLADHYGTSTGAGDTYETITFRQQDQVKTVVVAGRGGYAAAPPSLRDLLAALHRVNASAAAWVAGFDPYPPTPIPAPTPPPSIDQSPALTLTFADMVSSQVMQIHAEGIAYLYDAYIGVFTVGSTLQL
ncbi:MAG TPA: hypothetical protein VKY74_05340, partial [Chloroflexia bacterium]|nr:hypothetical protein [Chloroflexia bacterium]